MSLIKEFNTNIDYVIEKIRKSQTENIELAAQAVAETVRSGGILQAFGSGHSFAGAIEIAGRAGGFIPSKAIDNFYGINGWLETVPGVGSTFIKHVDIEPEDTFFIISNSGRNPLHTEFAKHVKEIGCKLIILTNVKDASKNKIQGESILDYADIILDNCGYSGDCSIEVKDLGIKVAPTSSIAVSHLVSMITLRAIEIIQELGETPPIYKSANVDGGREYNQELRLKYKNRLNRT